MSRQILAGTLLLFSNTLAAEIRSCSLPNNKDVQKSFNNRSSDAAFDTFGKNTGTVVKFNGSQGTFQRQGQSAADSLTCIRYFKVNEAIDLAAELQAEGLDVGTYFDTSKCDAIIAADWATGNAKGRVLWCVPNYSPGASLEGVFWKNFNWEKAKFDGNWNGTWK